VSDDRQHVYVLIAVDEDERVRESFVVTDYERARQLFARLQEIWGGARVALASRFVDDVPQNVARYAMRKEIEDIIQDASAGLR